MLVTQWNEHCTLQESGHYSWLCDQPRLVLTLLNVISGAVAWRSGDDCWERSVNAFIRVLVVARTYGRHEPPRRVARNLDFPWIMRSDSGRFRMILTCSLYRYTVVFHLTTVLWNLGDLYVNWSELRHAFSHLSYLLSFSMHNLRYKLTVHTVTFLSNLWSLTSINWRCVAKIFDR